MEQFNLDYFITYFDDIPGKYYSVSSSKEEFSVYDWCQKEEAEALYKLTAKWGLIEDANDDMPGYSVFGETIKDRIVNFLTYVKGREDES